MDAASLAALPVARYRLHLTALTPVRLPRYAGSAWRGVFGHALRHAVCVTRQPHCPACVLYRSCAYPYLFETPPDPDGTRMRRYPAAPHPLVIEPWPGPQRADAGEALGVDVVLLGRGNAHLGYVVHAFTQAGARGIGGGTYALDGVAQESTAGWETVHVAGQPLRALAPTPPQPPPLPASVGVQLESPLRLVRDGHLVTPDTFRLADLFGSLMRRAASLAHFHGDGVPEMDFPALRDAAAGVALQDARLRWRDGARYSSRQGREVPLGGIVGRFALAGAAIAPLWPLLWLGQWTHAGKGAVMGLGRYRLVMA